ncbi:hypothetical protein [Vitiosangium sp. GDMCC 1.1324]|uniref:hypothetical protein n=1 Tax=Vitiosangium sp. (strain GDMCC 1.1324) TaxID=2138576 RepID=UPI000D35591A|nr:hypothetical protein [Vitiosangium sp. GDMCC 1.1324]PTL80821.1 hypothetical protein DAT35_26130 [Vitiosangium sp. GDMCC 1.1324]
MAHALNEYLRLSAPHLSPRLISPTALEDIERIARLLPPVSASGFECRLGKEEALADFGVRFLAADGSRGVLAGRGDTGLTLSPSLFVHPVWERLRRFGAHWDEPGTLLQEEIRDVFLEFDVEGAPAPVPIPSFFIEYERKAWRRLEALEESLALLWGEPLAPAVRDRVVDCLAALPPEGQVSAVGAMFSRRFDGVRLCLQGLGPGTMPGYLARIGWPGDLAELEALLAPVADRVERMALSLDVGAAVLPKVGVECHLAESLHEADTARWTALLDALVAQGLCLPAKREALVGWLGHTHLRSHPEVLPGNLRALSTSLAPRALPVFLRRINHLKLVLQPGQPPEAKAYIALLQRWLGHDVRRQRYVFGDLEEVRDAVLA